MPPEDFAVRFFVSRETMDRLACYERLLREWGQGLSLVGRSTLDDIWLRHFADSAQLLPHVTGRTPLLDMGTGAGFPGMVLAIMGLPDVHLSDNNQKKIAFLHEVAAQTGTKVTINNCKVEAVRDTGFGTLVARGLAPLGELLPLAARLLHPGTQALLLKGRKAEQEVADARKSWNFACEFLPSLTSEGSAILRLSQIARREAA